MSKDLINVGVAGDATSGDRLFVGGNKINSMFSEIYDAFGKQGANPQLIHATGYFQTPPRNYFNFPVVAGSQLNVDTRNGVIEVKLPNGKLGEQVRIRDPFGAWLHSPVTVRGDGVERIDGSLSPVVFGVQYLDVIFTCTNDAAGSVNWTYSMSRIDNRELRIIDKTFEITNEQPLEFTLGSLGSFTSAKLLVTGLRNDGEAGVTSSEIHIAHDGTTHVYNESSVLSTSSARVYNIDFYIQSGVVIMRLTTPFTESKVMVRSTDFTHITI